MIKPEAKDDHYIWSRDQFKALTEGMNLVDICRITGRAYSTVWRYTKVGAIPVEVIDRLKAAQALPPVESPKRLVCKLEKCGYEWIGRTKNPVVCPKCHSRDWQTGINTKELYERADRCLKMSRAYDFSGFAAMMGTTAEKMAKYYGRERVTMSEQQLAHIEAVLKDKGLWY